MGINMNRYLLFILIAILASCSPRSKTARRDSTPVPAPVVKDTVASPVTPVPSKEEKKKTEINIGLVLPLQLDIQFEEDSGESHIPAHTLPALHFYEGALLALDSLNNDSYQIKLSLTDIPSDSLRAAKVFNDSKLLNPDAVIAMVTPTLGNSAATYSRKGNRPVFILQSGNTQLLDYAPNLWLTIPSNLTQIQVMAAFLFEKNPGAAFIAVHRDVRNEDALAKVYASQIDSSSGKKGTCQLVQYNTAGWNTLKTKLDKTKLNVLIIPSSDESYIVTLLNKLDEVKNEYRIMLAGLPTWLNFESLDPARLQEYNTHLFDGLNIDYSQPKVQQFRKQFIDTYHTDPLPQAYQAYDLVNYISKNLSTKKGEDKWKEPFPSLVYSRMGFRFEESCPGCGKENKSLPVVKFENYKLVRADN